MWVIDDTVRAAPSRPAARAASADELAFVKLRYKQPDADVSKLIERPLHRSELQASASPRLRFAAAVVAFADSLRGGTHLGDFNLDRIAALARDAGEVGGADADGYRAEFVRLVDTARRLRQGERRAEIAVAGD